MPRIVASSSRTAARKVPAARRGGGRAPRPHPAPGGPPPPRFTCRASLTSGPGAGSMSEGYTSASTWAAPFAERLERPDRTAPVRRRSPSKGRDPGERLPSDRARPNQLPDLLRAPDLGLGVAPVAGQVRPPAGRLPPREAGDVALEPVPPERPVAGKRRIERRRGVETVVRVVRAVFDERRDPRPHRLPSVPAGQHPRRPGRIAEGEVEPEEQPPPRLAVASRDQGLDPRPPPPRGSRGSPAPALPPQPRRLRSRCCPGLASELPVRGPVDRHVPVKERHPPPRSSRVAMERTVRAAGCAEPPWTSGAPAEQGDRAVVEHRGKAVRRRSGVD